MTSVATKAIMETATKAFVACSAVPQVSFVRVEAPTNQKDYLNVRTGWSSVSPVAGTKRAHTTLDVLPCKDGVVGKPLVRTGPVVAPIDDSSSIRAYSTELNKQVMIFKNSKGDFILEVWDDVQGLVKTVSLTDLEAHGDVYLDDSLGCLAVAPLPAAAGDGEGSTSCCVAYVAEEKRPKAVAFTKGFGASFKPADDNDASDQNRGKEYGYVEDWGEQLVGKSQTVIVKLNLDTGKAVVFARKSFGVEKDNPNVHKVLPDDFCVGKVVFGANPDILYGQAVSTVKRRLGLVYCDNRPSHIFRLEGDEYTAVSASSEAVSATNPKYLRETGSVLWTERDLGIDNIYPGSHKNCSRLMLINRDGTSKIVQDIVKQFDPDTDDYAGIYPLGGPWPTFRFTLGDRFIVVNTVVTCNPLAVVIDITTGQKKTMLIKKVVHDVQQIGPNEYVLAGDTHNTLTAPSVFLTTIKLVNNDTVEVTDESVLPGAQDKVDQLLPGEAGDYETRYWSHSPRDGTPVKFGSFYVGPKSALKGGKLQVPMIIWLHGGPHSVFQDRFMPEVLYFLNIGYAVLTVNYRGSLGYGQDSVQSLMGKIGTNDVADCVQGIEECLLEMPQVKKNELFLFGGSHGGFLVTHLAGQCPDMFKAVVARNAVVHTPSMSDTTDIPDWVSNETGANYNPAAFVPTDLLDKMFVSSPAAHVADVKPPIYFMVGSQDLRVPAQQGVGMYRALRAAGKDARLNIYEDCHPLAKVPVHTDVMINLAVFFSENRG